MRLLLLLLLLRMLLLVESWSPGLLRLRLLEVTSKMLLLHGCQGRGGQDDGVEVGGAVCGWGRG